MNNFDFKVKYLNTMSERILGKPKDPKTPENSIRMLTNSLDAIKEQPGNEADSRVERYTTKIGILKGKIGKTK